MDDYNLSSEFLAAKYARLFSHHKKPMGAYIKHRKFRLWGWNKQKTHPIFANGKKWYSIHAEIDCILQSRNSLENAEIWIYREIKGKPAMAKPCINCLKILIEARIKRIWYTIPEFPYYERIDL